MTGHWRPGSPGSRRCGATASLAPFRAVALRARRLLRTAAPLPAAAGPRRHDLRYRATRAGPSVTFAPGAQVAGRRVSGTGPERHALSGSAPPASTVLRIPLRGTRLRRAVDPGASTDPAGLTARARPEARPDRRAANLPAQHYKRKRGSERVR